jgi:hypothetical protein
MAMLGLGKRGEIAESLNGEAAGLAGLLANFFCSPGPAGYCGSD